MNLFLIIALIVGSLVASILGFRLTNLGIASWVIALIPTIFIFLYPFVWNSSLSPDMDSLVRKIIHFSMGIVSALLGLVVIRDILFFPTSYIHPTIGQAAYSTEGTQVLIGLGLFMLAFGYWNAGRGPKVVQVNIPIDIPNFSIVQISDLHAGPAVGKEFVDDVVDTIISLNPSAVVLTGDIADGEYAKYGGTVEAFKKISKDIPIYYVTGNHEYFKDGEAWIERFRNLGMKVLLNENSLMNFDGWKILFAGVIDPANSRKGPSITEALRGAPESDLRILLAHQPNIANQAAPFFDVQLSGHTHRGQFFPWNFAIHLFQEFAGGLEKVGNMWTYVNSGTGFWGPPIRIGTRSEISMISFKKEN